MTDKQEPVAWTPLIERHYKEGVLISQTIQYNPQGEKLPYPHEPKREWVGLTEAEVADFVKDWNGVRNLVIAMEAKLKEKNT